MLEYFPKSIYYPRESVEEKLAAGELDITRQRLYDFASRHKEEILVHANDIQAETNEALIEALQGQVLRKGTIHPPADMGAQIQEIQKETWYQGETGQDNPEWIAEHWQEKFAAQWREARTYEVFILIEKEFDNLVELLKQ